MTISVLSLLDIRSPVRLIIRAFALALFIVLFIAMPSLAFPQTSDQASSKAATASSSTPPDQAQASSKPLHAKASWYGPGFQGHETSTGQRFNQHELTAASSNVPLGSTAEVKNLQNGREVKVKINDCGPAVAGRKLDLSSRAANRLKMKHAGVVPVEVRVLHTPADAQPCVQ
jgi:peptidoglycan lytic transglycosylase